VLSYEVSIGFADAMAWLSDEADPASALTDDRGISNRKVLPRPSAL